MPKLNGLSLVVASLLIACSGELARATEPPTDLCSLLPAAVLSKAVGQTYGAPTATVAPRPFPNTNEGTDCTYKSGEHSFLFRVYVDPSASASAHRGRPDGNLLPVCGDRKLVFRVIYDM